MSDQWSPLTERNLMHALKEVIDWKLLGLRLKMSTTDLKMIEHDYSRLNDQKFELFTLWLKRDPQASWENVLDALKQMELHDLARRVQSGFCPAGINRHRLIAEQRLIPNQSSQPVSESNTGQELYGSHQSSPKQYDQQSELSPGVSATLLPITTGVATHPPEQRLRLNEQPGQASTTPLQIAGIAATPPHSVVVAQKSPEDRLSEIEDAINQLERKFRDLVFSAQEVLSDMADQSRHFLSKLRTCIALLPATRRPMHLRFLEGRQDDIFRASSVGRIFYILSLYWSFTNYQLLEHLITSLGDDQLKMKLQAYLDDLKVFEENTSVKDFIHVRRSYLDLPPNFSEVAVKLKDEWADYSLSRVYKLCQELSERSSLNAFSTIFTGGSINSIHLQLAVPSSTLHLLAAALNDKFLHDHGVEVAHIKGVELHAYQRQCVQRRELQLEREDHNMTSPPEDLVKACRNGDVMKTLRLMDEGADVNASARLEYYGKEYHTPLTVSSQQGHSDIVSALLCSDADVNKPDGHPYDPWTPLMLASQEGRVPVVHLLLEHHADVNIHSGKFGYTALCLASANNHLEIVHLLLEARAGVDARDWVGETALMEASSWGNLDVVRLLLAQGAKLNVNLQDSWGETALMRASSWGYLDVVRLLLAQGASVTLQDIYGQTALFKASMRGHSSVVQELLQGGADPNIPTEEGLMPLIVAIKLVLNQHYPVATESRIATVKMLLTVKASVETQEQSTGWTALFFAANEGIVDIVRLLIQHGANPSAVDKQGLTPLDVARDRGHSDVCKELEKYLTTETKETHYQEPDSEIQKPDSKEPPTTESQEAHSPNSETTEPDSGALKSQQSPGVEETTPTGVLLETESNRSKSVRRRMEEARRRILAVFGRLQERLLQSRAEKTRALTEQQEIPYPSQKQHPGKEEIPLEKVQD